MRYAIISDVHSNLEALRAVMALIDGLKADRIICLGDAVGYNADPNECVDILRARGIRCVMGNHDERAAGLAEPDDFNLFAEEAIRWTRARLTDENKAFLAGLPRKLVADKRFLAFHGWVDDTDRYIMGGKDALGNFALMKEEAGVRLGFFGHTHIPIAYIDKNEEILMNLDNEIQIEKDAYYLINPGSVGQPRNHDPRASFVVYDSRRSEAVYQRAEYDVAGAARKILDAGLPERLAERLKLGW
ncbi:MAG: metallophosphoesterase family protein [Deltaproteobacteria bacterium]|nr:metallophosphoesterase family protein [Deltaproteobacteria bacterium]